MNAYDLVPARRSAVVLPALTDWIDRIARCVIEQAAGKTSATLSERLREEWMADFSEQQGLIARLRFAFGCYWAAMIINSDRTASTAAIGTPSLSRIMSPNRRYGMGFSPQLINLSGSGSLMCEINTTPLVDIMLVLLITLILSLPIMTHVVKLNLPQTTTSQLPNQPEVIDLDIYSDGSVLWNGSPIANLNQLEGYFRTESRKALQPEVHLHPYAHVRYDVVAKVLAAAQRNGMSRLSFVNNAEFLH
jgi:biopolymer transport protein ExbD